MMNPFLAAEGSVVDVSYLTLGTTIVVFILFFLLAAKFVWPHILTGLDQREQKLKNDLDAAEEAREQAKQALAQYEEELKKARAEASEMIAQAKQDAKVAAEELRSSNVRELAELKATAASEIETAKQAAIGEIHTEASSLSVAIASKILQREISADDQQKIVRESLDEIVRGKK